MAPFVVVSTTESGNRHKRLVQASTVRSDRQVKLLQEPEPQPNLPKPKCQMDSFGFQEPGWASNLPQITSADGRGYLRLLVHNEQLVSVALLDLVVGSFFDLSRPGGGGGSGGDGARKQCYS